MIKNREREAPVFANINLLGKCNVDCYFCLGKDIPELLNIHNHNNVHFSEWKNFEQFLQQCKDANIKNLYITGQNTDALVYKYVGELIDYLQDEHGFDVGIRTNGYLAEKKIDIANKCKRSVGYSIHSLSSDTNYSIMKREDIPDWDNILKNTNNCRVSIVLNRYNVKEMPALLWYLAKFDNIKYIQVRKISTDTRLEELQIDRDIYEKFYKEEILDHVYPLGRIYAMYDFYGATAYDIFGKEVIFWSTVETCIDSFNYFTDGTISNKYFVVEGYQNNYENN